MAGQTDQANTDVFASIREQFPGVAKWAYFDVAARGLLPRPSREAVDQYFDSLMFDGGDKAEMFKVVEFARTEIRLAHWCRT